MKNLLKKILKNMDFILLGIMPAFVMAAGVFLFLFGHLL